MLQRFIFTLILISLPDAHGALKDSDVKQVREIVSRIQRADYDGDRDTLKKCYDELAPFISDGELGPKVQYWRGFAMWRRALNGFNESVDVHDSEKDIKLAVSEFEAALKKEPGFVDAKASAGATLGTLMAIYAKFPELAPEFKDAAHKQQTIKRALTYMNDAATAEPNNPRAWWVLGPAQRYLAQERGESPDKGADDAVQMFQKGLKAAQAARVPFHDVLTPSWGEPECLMSLAASSLYRPKPDIERSEQYARAALAAVPNWHYVKDILIPQIETAKAKLEIIAMERAALDRWGKGDPQGYLDIMAPEVTYFDPTSEKRLDGVDAVKEYIARVTGQIRIESYDMINPQVQRDADTAVLTFNLIDTVKKPDREEKATIRWNSTEVYRRIGRKWRIVHSHWSFTKPELKQPIL